MADKKITAQLEFRKCECVHAIALSSSITSSSIHLRSVAGSTGGCVGSVRGGGGGELTVCPHTAPASA